MTAPRETVVTARPVRVRRVPDGTPEELPAGTSAQITQALGSSITLLVDGRLVRLDGADADAIGKPLPVAPTHPADVSQEELRNLVWQALKTCYDPEVPIDIVELGLVYSCDVLPMERGTQFEVSIEMTLTSPGCGMGEVIVDDVYAKVMALPRVGEVTVDIVFDPPWDRYRLSEGARLALGL